MNAIEEQLLTRITLLEQKVAKLYLQLNTKKPSYIDPLKFHPNKVPGITIVPIENPFPSDHSYKGVLFACNKCGQFSSFMDKFMSDEFTQKERDKKYRSYRCACGGNLQAFGTEDYE